MNGILDVKVLVHGVMIAFAGASLGNIHEFFRSAGHPDEVAWPLAVALGSALVILSIMLTRVDHETDRTTFRWLAATALLLGGISGALQSRVYAAHLPNGWAMLLGYGIPIGGEVLLSVAFASYQKARERERFRSVSLMVETAVADQLERALEEFDPEAIHQHVEDTLNRLARQAMGSVEAQALRFYEEGGDGMVKALPEPSGFGPQNLEKAKAVRAETMAAQAEETKATILALLADQDLLGSTAIAQELGIHRDTALKYAKELEQDGLLVSDKRKWRLARPGGSVTG